MAFFVFLNVKIILVHLFIFYLLSSRLIISRCFWTKDAPTTSSQIVMYERKIFCSFLSSIKCKCLSLVLDVNCFLMNIRDFRRQKKYEIHVFFFCFFKAITIQEKILCFSEISVSTCNHLVEFLWVSAKIFKIKRNHVMYVRLKRNHRLIYFVVFTTTCYDFELWLKCSWKYKQI